MIHIIQPAIPKYRIPFFSRLAIKLQGNISFFGAQQDFLGVKSDISKLRENVVLSEGFFSFKNILFWHKKLPLFKYKKDDVVVLSGNPRILNYMLLLLVCRLRGIKTIWWGHGWSAGSKGLFSRIRIKMMGLANAVLLYTDYEKDHIFVKNRYALNNGLDSEEINCAIKKANIERCYDVPLRSLVFIGRLTDKAELSFLFKALLKTKINCNLNIIGGGEKEQELKLLATKLNIAHRVKWFGPIFDEVEIAKVMLSSHAFIYAGSVGLSLIHAFNYGLPAIIHNQRVLHMPEFAAFLDGVNGCSFERNSIDDAAHKIDYLLSLNKEEILQYSICAKKTISDTYNVNDMVTRFSNLIQELSVGLD